MRKRLIAVFAVGAIVATACGSDSKSSSSSAATTTAVTATTTALTTESTSASTVSTAATSDSTATSEGTAATDSSEAVATTEAATDTTVATSAGPITDVPGIKDGKIIVGGVNQENAFAGLGDGAKARFDRFNAEGGIDGLTIDYVGVRDDGGDADRDTSLVKELVEKDDVYAIVPSTPTNMQPATGDYLASKNVPYFGYGYAPVMCTDYAFAFNGCTVPGIAKTQNTGSVASLLPLLNKDPTDGAGVKIAIAGRAEAGGQDYVNVFKGVSEHVGMDVVYAEANVPSGGTADMQPFADAIIASKPDMVQLVTDFPSALALKYKLLASGYEGIVADNAAYVPGLLDQSAQAAAALEGTYVVTTYPTPLESSDFAKQMLKDLDGVQIQSGTIIGYLEAELFIDLLQKVAPNFATFTATVNKGVTITPADGGLPTQWPEFHSGGAPCNSVVKIENKQYLLKVPFACYDSVAVAG
jgi:branched-chain amino acid transport system substrate-binding protein